MTTFTCYPYTLTLLRYSVISIKEWREIPRYCHSDILIVLPTTADRQNLILQCTCMYGI